MSQQSDSPGKAVLIANVNGTNRRANFIKRTGCEKDLDNMKKVFAIRFGFETINDGKANDITLDMWDHGDEFSLFGCECIACTIKTQDYTNDKYFLLAVSSHGGINSGGQLCVKMSGGEYLPINNVIETLSHEKLSNVTKILIVCACRGKVCFVATDVIRKQNLELSAS